MAEPSEGAYALINVASQKALDVLWANKKYDRWLIESTRHSDWLCQTWIFDKQSNGWQITNYATWGCLDASDSTNYAQQRKDSNSNVQRWTVESDGGTATISGSTYTTYTIRPKSAASKYLATVSGSKWISLVTTSSSATRWALVPISTIADNGSYYIIPASDAKKCMEISAGSKSNGAKALVAAKNTTKSYQTFKVTVNQENFAIRIVNQNSNKSLDIWTANNGTPDYVGQYTTNSSSTSQQWAPIRSGSVKINGVNYPTYVLRSEKYTEPTYSPYAMSISGSSVKMAPVDLTSASQRFAFIPVEYLDNGLTVPGAASSLKTLTRTGTGTVTVAGFKFSSSYSKFQARYRLIKYQANRKQKTVTKWCSLNGGSLANDGWGPASVFINAAPKSGVVTIPADVFSKTYALNATTIVAIDFELEVRAFSDIKKNGSVFLARSTERSTRLKIRQRPNVLIKTLELTMKGDKGSGDLIGVTLILSDSLGEGCSNIKARLIGADSVPISNWVSSTSMTLSLFAGENLYRLPNQNEKIGLSYTFVTKQDSVTVKGIAYKTFAFESSEASPISIARDTDGSLTALVDIARHEADKCFMEIPFLSGKKMIPCPFYKIENGHIKWLCVPPLNKSTRVLVYSKVSGSNSISVSESSIFIESHTAIWNWGSSPSANYTRFATLFLNPDNPPQQKRAFATDMQFHTPAGRVLPVAFASRALAIDLSVTGVSVDPDSTNYVASGPLPSHNEVMYLIMLSELAGLGIHPIYRTPYGDWHQVGISSVDVSKNAIGYSDVSINQRALED